jgi:hypothetical protein
MEGNHLHEALNVYVHGWSHFRPILITLLRAVDTFQAKHIYLSLVTLPRENPSIMGKKFRRSLCESTGDPARSPWSVSDGPSVSSGCRLIDDLVIAGDVSYSGSRDGVITCFGIVGMVTLSTSEY